MIPATYRPSNLGNFTTTPTRFHKCKPGGSDTFVIDPILQVTTTSPLTNIESNFKDLRLRTTSYSSTKTDYLVNVRNQQLGFFTTKTITYESSNTSVLQNPISGVASAVSAGSATLIARASDGEVSAKKVDISFSAPLSITSQISVASGSLNKHCNDQIQNLLVGKDRTPTDASAIDVWVRNSNGAQTYQWNNNFWGKNINNITCVSVWNSWLGHQGAGTLISPRHIYGCHHMSYFPYHPVKGATVRFIRPDGGVEDFTVTDVLAHPYASGWIVSAHDAVVCKLDRDVPESIKFAKVLPVQPKPYLPTVPTATTTPKNSLNTADWAKESEILGCYMHQSKRLATAYLQTLPNSPYPQLFPGQFSHPESIAPDPPRASWRTGIDYSDYLKFGENLVLGDSGHPAFLLINNELVLINVWTGIGLGYALHPDRAIINDMMTQLGGGYQLTQVDLTGFPTYA